MERISHRESLLLGYSTRRSFMNEQSSSQEAIRGSEIDFDDVFGGPPRRSSMHDIRCSSNDREATDSYDGDDKTIVSRSSWNCIREKPVFGEEVLNGRRHRSDNFFDDIFKGNASSSSSQRKRDWDHPFSLSPLSSRISSPARPLPPKADPSETSFPADFSLPAKLTKGVELPAYGSAPRFPEKSKEAGSSVVSHSSSPLLKSSSLQYSQEERNDTQPSYRQSILSRELSLGSKDVDLEAGGHSKVESHSSEILTTGNHFHFSIYKWASKEVPFVMSLRGVNSSKPKERIDSDRFSSSNEWVESRRELPKETFHGTNLPLHDRVSPDTKSFTAEHDKQKENTHMATSTVNREETWPRDDPGNAASQNTGEETIPHSQSDKNVLNELEKVSVVAEEAPKSEMKPLASLFCGDSDYAPCIKETSKKDSEIESKVQDSKRSSVTLMPKNKKNQDGRRGEVGKGSIQVSPMNSKDPGKTRVKGKVKEFVNIFNQETLSKTKISVDPVSRSSRVKDIRNSKAEKEASLSNVAADEKTHLSCEPEKKLSPDTPITVNDNLPHSQKQHSIQNTNSMSNRTSGWKNSSSTEIQGNSSKEVAAVIDEPFQENFLVKELTQDDNKLQKNDFDPEELQVIDVKIGRWSNGKDKNIRSLLTTLQYVLWPGSGWKPVPLVDIIEGNAVKRCYQKALLCLHPDKLQQKSATSEQKYLAEKVFDILQDAWGHFNSLGSL